MKLLSVDPSIRSVGLAYFDRELKWSSRVFVEKTEQCTAERCLRMAATIVTTVIGQHKLEPNALIFEWPQIYTVGKQVGDPNDLIAMAGVGSALAALLVSRLEAIYSPKPGDWTHIPKKCPMCKSTPGKKTCKTCKGSAWNTPRGTLIAESLSPHEKRIVHDQHDEIDAVGLGLWRHGRLITRRVFPGAV